MSTYTIDVGGEPDPSWPVIEIVDADAPGDEAVAFTSAQAEAFVGAVFDAHARGELKPGWTFTLPEEETGE